MNKSLFKNVFIAFMSLALIANVFTACSDDKKDDPADKVQLSTLINECETLLKDIDRENYTNESITTFQEMIDFAKSVLADENASQSTVNNVYEQLRQARNTFLNSALDGIPEEALLLGLSFDVADETVTQLTTEGRNLTATFATGPTEIFGSNTNLPIFTEGRNGIGRGLYFSNGAHLEIANYPENDFLGKELSISVWLKPEETRPGNYIISCNYWESWKLNLQADDKPFFTVKNSDEVGADMDNEIVGSVSPGKWTHLVVTLNMTEGKVVFYIDGEETKIWNKDQRAGIAGTMNRYAKNLPLLIGAATTYEEALEKWDWTWNTPSTWDNYVGVMDELKVYNIELSQGQVTRLHEEEK